MKICPECRSLCQDTSSACPQCGTGVSAEHVVDGDRLDGVRLTRKYELAECVGEGAMGWVYRAIHADLGSSVAVKIMKPKATPDQRRALRFKQEARAASRLHHPNIVSVIDFGETASGLLYLITEFLQGRLLSEVIAESGRLELDRAQRIMFQILEALHEIHGAGLVHRDLKPDNLMITSLPGHEDFVRVLDFGIVKQLAEGQQKLTQHGQLFGTPNYMAPEQVRSQEVTAAADLYSAGIILYEMLTGRVPFDSDVLFEVLQAHLYEDPPRLDQMAPDAQYPEELQKVLDRALAKKPGERFDDAASFRNALKEAFRHTASIVCPGCNDRVERGARFCPSCGHSMRGRVQPRAPKDAGMADTLFAPPRGAAPAADQAARSNLAVSRIRSGSFLSLPFVERGSELRALGGLASGEPSVVHVMGGNGMGKTTLARKAAEACLNAGFKVLWVEPHPSQVPLPWGAVRSAVEQVLDLGKAPAAGNLNRAVASRKHLERDLPGLTELFGLPGPLEQAEPEIRKQEAVTSAVRTVLLENTGPSLVVFEDADFYDEPSMEFLTLLAQKCVTTSTRLLATSALPVLDLGPSAATVDLAPLTHVKVSGLFRLSAGISSKLDPAAVQALIRQARGNPLRIQEIVGLGASLDPEAEHTIPELISARIQQLPPEVRNVVDALAVLGLEAPSGWVATVLGAPSVGRDLVRLLRVNGFLERNVPNSDSPQPAGDDEASGPGALRLAHPAMVQAARTAMSEETRTSLNLKALELLTRHGAPQAVLAHHALQGKDFERAVDLLERSGDAALKMHDANGAIQQFRQAVETGRGRLLLDEAEPRLAGLNVKLGRALAAGGDLDTAQMVLKSAGSVRGGSAADAALVRHSLAKVVWAQQRPMQAMHLMYQAIGDAIMSGNAELIAEVYLDLSKVLVSTGNGQTALAELGEAVDLISSGRGPDSAGGPTNLWKLLAQMARVMRDEIPGEDGAQAALMWAGHGLRNAERTSSIIGLAECHSLLANLHRLLNDEQRASDHYATALKYFRQTGDRGSQSRCLAAVAETSKENTDLLLQEAQRLGAELMWGSPRQAAGKGV